MMLAHARTAAAGGTATSELPTAACGAGQSIAPIWPVPRWSNMTSRYACSTGASLAASRETNGTPGCPGPPVSSNSTPRGAAALSAAATCSRSVPRRWPKWSSGTVSVEQVNPVIRGHGWGWVSRGRVTRAGVLAVIDPLAVQPAATTAPASATDITSLTFRRPIPTARTFLHAVIGWQAEGNQALGYPARRRVDAVLLPSRYDPAASPGGASHPAPVAA